MMSLAELLTKEGLYVTFPLKEPLLRCLAIFYVFQELKVFPLTYG